MKTCLRRFIGNCEKCKEDYDFTHHPNNGDCKRYYEINYQALEVKEEIEKNALGRKISSKKI